MQTVPLPEYTSGHSLVSGAASEVLTTIFGNNFAFDDTTGIPYGLKKEVLHLLEMPQKKPLLAEFVEAYTIMLQLKMV